MKKLALVLTLVAMLVAAVPAAAVKYGTPDTTNAYPWVGLMVAVDPEDPDGEPLWRCTGSLLSPDLFLTAGHCVGDPPADPADQPVIVYIWFTNEVIVTDPVYLENVAEQAANPDVDIDLCEGVSGYPCGGYDAYGIPVAHEDWTGGLTIPQTHDVGLVTDLVWTGEMPATFGQLAPIGYLDDLAYENGKGNVEFTVVGFGLQSVKPVESAIKQRMIGTVSLVNLQSALAGGWNLHYSNNPGLGHGGSGGTCFGDSGGPVIRPERELPGSRVRLPGGHGARAALHRPVLPVAAMTDQTRRAACGRPSFASRRALAQASSRTWYGRAP
jgi:hypothetical protein